MAAVASSARDRLNHFTSLLMDSGDGVLARRLSRRQRKGSGPVRDGEPRMIHDADVSEHPWMNVALELHKHFRAVEDKGGGHALHGLPDVSSSVAGLTRQRVDVVQKRIRIAHVECLSHLHAQHSPARRRHHVLDRGPFALG